MFIIITIPILIDGRCLFISSNKEEKYVKKNSVQELATGLRDFSNSVKLNSLYSKGGQLDIIKCIIENEKSAETISLHLNVREKFKECVYKKVKNFSGLTKAWIEDVYSNELGGNSRGVRSGRKSSGWYDACDAAFSKEEVVAKTSAQRKKDILQKFDNMRINWPKIWFDRIPRKTFLNRREAIFDPKVKSELKEISKIIEGFVYNIKKIKVTDNEEYTNSVEDDLIESYGDEFKVALREFRDFMLQDGAYKSNGKSFSVLCLNKNSLFIQKKFDDLMAFTKERSSKFSFTKKWINQVSDRLEKFCKGTYQKSLNEYRAARETNPSDSWDNFQKSCRKDWQQIWKISGLKKLLPGRLTDGQAIQTIKEISNAF